MRDGLHLDYCSYEAAKHAVMRWHYSRRMPKSKLVRIGVWEERRFVGAQASVSARSNWLTRWRLAPTP